MSDPAVPEQRWSRLAGTLFVIAAACMGVRGQSVAGDPSCTDNIRRGVICEAANRHVLADMRADGLTAITVVHDVRTGALVAYAASHPELLDVNARVLPLSFMKVFLAASWWDHAQPNRTFDCAQKTPRRTVRMSIHDMLVTGCDLPGNQMAVALRRSVGGTAMITDLRRYLGDDAAIGASAKPFWASLDQSLKSRLNPAPPMIALESSLGERAWGDLWSIGEANVSLSILHLSRFLQAVGNDGMEVPLTGGSQSSTPILRPKGHQLLRPRTAALIQSALRDAVRRGTARGSDAALEGTGWAIGGKTGSGPLQEGQEMDGLFAGLIFDRTGRARFTTVTLVKHGGFGGGHAARLSAALARFLADSVGRP